MILKRIGAFILDILQVIVFAIAIFLFVYLLILQPHKIKGSSMHPNFPDGEYLLTDKLSYRFNEPQRGDIIVFRPPGSEGDEFIKRIVGIPGDRVMIREGNVYVNGNRLQEQYIPAEIQTSAGVFAKEGIEEIVPPNHYFVLGDNRPQSSDSRVWGFVKKDRITGKAWLIYWPPDQAGLITKPIYAL